MKQKTYYKQYDVPYINQEAEAILKGEIGYAFCLSQVLQIQNVVNKPTEIYYGYYNKTGESVLKENQEGKPEYYAIKLPDEEIELIAYKQERLKWFETNLKKKVNIVLKKELMLQPSVTSVNRIWNKIYDLLTA